MTINPQSLPIFVQNVQTIGNLISALNNISNFKYNLKVLKDNEVKISTYDLLHFNKVKDLLNKKSMEYYTFQSKEQKRFRVILRNMHFSADQEDIKNELNEYGHEVMCMQNMLQARTKKPLSLFAIELKLKENNKDIFEITSLLHCKISFERPHKKKSLPQCVNYQKYGHTKNFCRLQPICVKCAGGHCTSKCPLKQNCNEVKCALCGENHTANFKGCTVYKKLRAQQLERKNDEIAPKATKSNMSTDPAISSIPSNKSSQRDKSNLPNTSGSNINSLSYITPSVSYAQATLCKESPATNSSANKSEINISRIIMELKGLMQQLMQQVANMLNMFNILITKSNDQNK